MKKLKLSLIFLSCFFLSGCLQSAGLIGPGLTVATSGNILQAGFQYGINTAVKNETGKYPLGYIKDSIDEKKNQKRFHAEFQIFLKNRIEVTRKKLSLN